ncbi:MAG: 50S ribosomal protein L24 [Nanoarchaeota archaeon]|nr:50S ribosomal protein L24 [Nanoarchaeota archaeon]
MPKCTFCGKDYEQHKGLTLVNSATGKITYLCSGKCKKNNNLRKSKKVKWTETFHSIKSSKLEQQKQEKSDSEN